MKLTRFVWNFWLIVGCALGGLAPAFALPSRPCTGMTERDGVPWDEFQETYTTAEGHFTIYYGLESQEAQDPTGTCFPDIFGAANDNTEKFVENVGAMLEQCYSFLVGDYAAPGIPDLGFDLPAHLPVKLYNNGGSIAEDNGGFLWIQLNIAAVYRYLDGDYRLLPHAMLHELIHVLQYQAGAPRGGGLVDWLWEGQAQYADAYFLSHRSGSGEFADFFDAQPVKTSFWDISQSLEQGSYHFGGRFWRFLTHNWSYASIGDAERDLSVHEITLPHDIGTSQVYYLAPRRGIELVRDVLAEITTRVADGTCPAGDECVYEAVSAVLADHTWLRPQGDLYDFDEVYRAYASENVRLETDNPVADRFGGKFKSRGKTTTPAVDQALIARTKFETLARGHYTVMVTAAVENGSQNGTGDDDDLRFELDGESFGGWNSAAAFDGNSEDGVMGTRFLRTSALGAAGGGLASGMHTLRVIGDESPSLREIRVVRGDIAPILAESPVYQTRVAEVSACNDDDSEGFDFHDQFVVDVPPFGRSGAAAPLDYRIHSVLRPQDMALTKIKFDGVAELYTRPTDQRTLTYNTDAQQIVESADTAGVPVSLRASLPGKKVGLAPLDLCSKGRGGTEFHTIDSVYVYRRPEYDVLAEIYGDLHEYSTHYETFAVDPLADEVGVELVGPTAGRFLTIHGVTASGGVLPLSPDVWQPTATPSTSYVVPVADLGIVRLRVGVGAYAFEAFDLALSDSTQRATIPYTLRMDTRYAPLDLREVLDRAALGLEAIATRLAKGAGEQKILGEKVPELETQVESLRTILGKIDPEATGETLSKGLESLNTGVLDLVSRVQELYRVGTIDDGLAEAIESQALGLDALAKDAKGTFVEPPSAERFLRGDVDGDGQQTVADARAILASLSRGGAELPCLDAADVNDDALVDDADAVLLLSSLLGDGVVLPEPATGCGLDPTPDALGCATQGPCEVSKQQKATR